MNNKYLLITVAALMALLWYYLGRLDFFDIGQDSGFSDDWWFAAILAVALGAGNTGGDNVLLILKEAVVGYIPTMLKLAFFALIGSLVWDIAYLGTGVDVTRLIAVITTFVVSATLVNATASYLKKA
jgi:hypothetical protein